MTKAFTDSNFIRQMGADVAYPVLAALLLFLCTTPSASAALILSSTSFDTDGQYVDFQWSGVQGVQESDVVALIHTSPADLESR